MFGPLPGYPPTITWIFCGRTHNCRSFHSCFPPQWNFSRIGCSLFYPAHFRHWHHLAWNGRKKSRKSPSWRSRWSVLWSLWSRFALALGTSMAGGMIGWSTIMRCAGIYATYLVWKNSHSVVILTKIDWTGLRLNPTINIELLSPRTECSSLLKWGRQCGSKTIAGECWMKPKDTCATCPSWNCYSSGRSQWR